MSRDLFEEYGISAPKKKNPVDLFEKENIYYPKESKGWGGMLSDALHKAIDTAARIPGQLVELPSELYGAAKQGFTEPARQASNIAAGFGQLGHGLLSAPGNIRDYLQRKDIVSKEAPSFRLPESILPKDYNYPEALGVQGEKAGDSLLRGIPTAMALSPAARLLGYGTSKIPGTNKAIANLLSRDKAQAIQKATAGYNDLFDAVKEAGVHKIPKATIGSERIIKHSQPKYHEALKKYLSEPTFENAHWAQSDLGGLVRHLKKLDESPGLQSTQQQALKEAIKAQNRIKESMFKHEQLKSNPNFESRYNQLNKDYASEVIPYKQLKELGEYENKKLKANKMVNSLINNDEFMLGLGQKYKQQLLLNKALRSKITKTLGGSALAGLGFEEGRRFIK